MLSMDEWKKRRVEILGNVQLVMGDLPSQEKRCPVDMQIEEITDCGSYVRKLISYRSEPNSCVPAYLLIPKSAIEKNRKYPAILCLHPTDDTFGHKVVVGLGGKENRQYASELADRGYITFAPAYPLLANYHPDLQALGYKSGSMKAIWDNICALDLLDSIEYVDKTIGYGVIGHSLGGHNAIFTAVFDKRIKVIVSSCGFDYFRENKDIRDWAGPRYMPELLKYSLDEIPFDFDDLIASLAPRCFLAIAPLYDDDFKWDSAASVVKSASKIYELYGASDKLRIEHPACGHDFPSQMRELAYNLFDRELNCDRESK